jgi:hypothetical protein
VFDPEDLTILFPIDAAALKRSKTDAEVRTVLKKTLVPMESLVASDVYTNLLSGVTQADADGNPLSEFVSEGIRSIPLANWFVVGMRFLVCEQILWASTPWFQASLQGRPVAERTCRPQIRLSVQPFGARTESFPDGREEIRGASDDKSFHLVFDYVGSMNAATQKMVVDAENRTNGEILKAVNAGTLSLKLFSDNVGANYSAPVVSALTKSRKELLDKVTQLRDAAKTSNLRVVYGASLDKHRAFLKSEISNVAIPRLVTQNFAESGRVPGTAQGWVFASFNPIGGNGSLKKTGSRWKKAPLSFLSVDPANSQVGGIVKAGHNEVFVARIGSAFALDPQMFASANKNAVTRKTFLDETGFLPFVSLKSGTLSDQSELLSGEKPSKALLDKMRVSLQQVNDPKRNAVPTLPCVSCHAAPGAREQFGLAYPNAAKLQGNRILTDETMINQEQLTPFWNLRLLGYFGRSPTLGERVIQETLYQVALANQMGMQVN